MRQLRHMILRCSRDTLAGYRGVEGDCAPPLSAPRRGAGGVPPQPPPPHRPEVDVVDRGRAPPPRTALPPRASTTDKPEGDAMDHARTPTTPWLYHTLPHHTPSIGRFESTVDRSIRVDRVGRPTADRSIPVDRLESLTSIESIDSSRSSRVD